MYYTVRSIDAAGSGWVEVEHKVLSKATGLSESRVRTILKEGEALGWFRFSRVDGRTFVKYTSERKYNRLHGNDIGTINKDLLKESSALSARVTQIRVVHEQYRVEQKLHRAIWSCKLPWKPILDQLDDRVARLSPTCDSYCRNSVNIFVGKEVYSVGISQVELSKRLNIPLSTLKSHLVAAPKIVPYKEVSTREAMESESFVMCDEESQRFYRRMPNYYKDLYTPKAVQQRKLKLRFDRLLPEAIEVAKLSAISMGFNNSRSGAIKAITKMGFSRFWKNLSPLLRQTPEGIKSDERKSEFIRYNLANPPEKRTFKKTERRSTKLEKQTAEFFGISLDTKNSNIG